MKNKKPYFPLFISLEEKRILVVGGGEAATKRVESLVPFCEHITVIAPKISKEIEKLDVTTEKRAYTLEDLDGFDFVFAATDKPEVDNEVYRICTHKEIVVSMASDKDKRNFYFPGAIELEVFRQE